jgi:hypothetical protein
MLKHAQKNKTLNKYLTSKLQFSPNFTLDSVADSNYRGKCDVGGFLIFEWTIHFTYLLLNQFDLPKPYPDRFGACFVTITKLC